MAVNRTRAFDTPRFSLSEFHSNDALGLYLLNRSTEALRYTGDVPFPSVAAASEFIDNYDCYERLGFGRWAVHEKTSGAFAGWCGLGMAREDEDIDIGFRFLPAVWGRGYATECAQATLTHALQVLRVVRVIGRAHPQNLASIRVLQKIGMQFVAEQQQEDGRWAIYAIERSCRGTMGSVT